jgi:hypothetical protein
MRILFTNLLLDKKISFSLVRYTRVDQRTEGYLKICSE